MYKTSDVVRPETDTPLNLVQTVWNLRINPFRERWWNTQTPCSSTFYCVGVDFFLDWHSQKIGRHWSEVKPAFILSTLHIRLLSLLVNQFSLIRFVHSKYFDAPCPTQFLQHELCATPLHSPQSVSLILHILFRYFIFKTSLTFIFSKL